MDDKQHLDILYVITKSNWGGAQRYVYECATAFSKDFVVGVAVGGDGALIQKLKEKNISVFPVEAFVRDISLLKEFHAAWELWRLFRQTHPDIVHLNSSKAGGLGALVAHLAGVPSVIFTSHGLTFEEDRPWWQKHLIYFFTWLTFILCSKVIIISEANYKVAQRMFLPKNRLILIQLGIPALEFRSKEDARTMLSKKIGKTLDQKIPWIGTIAELHPNKGLSYLIDAIDIVREKHQVNCVLIGDGELKESLARHISEKKLENTVFFAGFVEGAAAYLPAFDIVTLTSLKEGLPYVVLEAGVAGIPFVGSSLPGIQEIVTDMHSGILVQPKKTKEIAGALELLLEDAPRREKYAAEFHTHTVRTFDMQEQLEKTKTLYRECIRHASPETVG